MEGRGVHAHCPSCQGINIENLTRASAYQHLGLGDLRRSREECRMCDLLCKAFEENPYCLAAQPDNTDIWNNTWSLDMHLTEGLRPKLRLMASVPNGPPVVGELDIHTEEHDPARSVGFLPRLSLPISTRSHESHATARKWIEDCMLGHPYTQGCEETETQPRGANHKVDFANVHSRRALPVDTSKVNVLVSPPCQLSKTSQPDSNDRPRRLLHVQSRGTGLLLRLTDALSVSRAYATLSHCVRKPASLR